jgi:hypothetical protein
MVWTTEHKWQEAALLLRRRLFAEHESFNDFLTVKTGARHREDICETCKLLSETRWCMQAIIDRSNSLVTDARTHEPGGL